MAFNWLSFLETYNIPHTTTGHNARRGWVGIRCCWCLDDPSYHLGIRLNDGIYHCWRGNSHKGVSPYKLIMALINCSYSEAVSIYGTSTTFDKSEDTFADDALNRLGMMSKQKTRSQAKPISLEFLSEFMPIRNRGLCYRLVYPYLEDRGYSYDDVDWLYQYYKLRFAYEGVFAYRIIIPVFVADKLVTWTGRSIAKSEELRYKSLTVDPEKAAFQGLPTALANIKDTLLDWDNLRKGGRTLVVAEGPFDAFRLNFFGYRYNIKSTCLFGKQPSATQINLLQELSPRYKEIIGLLDVGADFDVFLTMPDDLRIKQLSLPSGVKDPAELSENQFLSLFRLK